MKESEAIEWIKKLRDSEEIREFYYVENFIKACNMAIQALEKQRPKRPCAIEMKESEKLIRNETEAIKCLKSNKPTSGYLMLQESIDIAMQALEKLSKIKEALKKWQKDTHRFYAADDETAELINKLINILEDNEK